jgi:aldose 1-epimerase
MVPAPSGRQTVLVHADQRAVVVEVGGGLRQYRAGDAEVLDGYAEDARCSAGRGEPLIPWPNRLDGGSYDFGDVHEQAPLNEPEKGNAIHGLTRWSSWEVLDAGTDHATMGLVLRPQPGWAWTLQLSITYRLRRDGLQVTLRAINRSDRPCPWGAGFHPYLLAPSGRVDDLELTVPAATRYLADERGLPTGTEPVAGSSVDFRAGRPIGDQQIDVAFKDLTRGSDGQAAIAVADPGSGRRVELRLDPGWDHVMVFTGDTVGARARQGLAVEPMTAPANMLRSGDGRIVLEPGRRWEASWSLAPLWL